MDEPATSAAALARRIAVWLDRLFPDGDRRDAILRALDDAFGADDRVVTRQLCREVEGVVQTYSRHFELEYVERGDLAPDADSPGWPPQDAGEVAARAGSVASVARDPYGVGVMALDSLDTLHLAAPFLESAFALLQGSAGVVLDLRRNGGGDLGTLTLVLDWLLGATPTHISDVVYKDRVRQWWTSGRPARRSLPPDTPVAVVISEETYSSGEALAYHVRSQGRGELIGTSTPGAADHITPIRLTPHVRGFMPEAFVCDAVTGENWEGAGVIPDLRCDPAAALDVARRRLRP